MRMGFGGRIAQSVVLGNVTQSVKGNRGTVKSALPVMLLMEARACNVHPDTLEILVHQNAMKIVKMDFVLQKVAIVLIVGTENTERNVRTTVLKNV